MKEYRVNLSVTYSGIVVVEADSAEEAEEIASEGVNSWVDSDSGELDFFDSLAEAEEVEE